MAVPKRNVRGRFRTFGSFHLRDKAARHYILLVVAQHGILQYRFAAHDRVMRLSLGNFPGTAALRQGDFTRTERKVAVVESSPGISVHADTVSRFTCLRATIANGHGHRTRCLTGLNHHGQFQSCSFEINFY